MIVVIEVVVAAAAYLEKRDIMNSKGFKSIPVFRLLLKHDLVIQYWKTFLIIIFLKTSLVVLLTYSMISKEKNCQDEKNLELLCIHLFSSCLRFAAKIFSLFFYYWLPYSYKNGNRIKGSGNNHTTCGIGLSTLIIPIYVYKTHSLVISLDNNVP